MNRKIHNWKIKLNDPNAQVPTRGHEDDLGYDLYSCEKIIVGAGETQLVRTGIQIYFEPRWGAILKDRSSIALKRRVFVHGGVIDPGYTGEINVVLYNSSSTWFEIEPGMRIAQLIPKRSIHVEFETVSEDYHEETDRGDGGFGSTGE